MLVAMNESVVHIDYARHFITPGEACAFVVAMLGNVTDSRYGALVFRASQHAVVTDAVRRLLVQIGTATERAGRGRQISSRWLNLLTDHVDGTGPGATVDVVEIRHDAESSLYITAARDEYVLARRIALGHDIAYRTGGVIQASWTTAPRQHSHGIGTPISHSRGALRVLELAAHCRECADGFYAEEGEGDAVLDDVFSHGLDVEDVCEPHTQGDVAVARWDDERWRWPGHVRGMDPSDDLVAGAMPKVLVSRVAVRDGSYHSVGR